MAAKGSRIIARASRDRDLLDTPYLPREGRDALPLPFVHLVAPVADLLRNGAGRARERVETLLVHRALAMKEQSVSTQPRFTIRTPHGDLELQCHAGNMEITARLEMGRAHILGRELVLSDIHLPATVCTGLAGEPVSRIADIPVLAPGVRILRARALTKSTRLVLDLPQVQLFLSEIRYLNETGSLWNRNDDDPLAMSA